jgi:hypothetical protein
MLHEFFRIDFRVLEEIWTGRRSESDIRNSGPLQQPRSGLVL